MIRMGFSAICNGAGNKLAADLETTNNGTQQQK
jgi:hypothetical protein